MPPRKSIADRMSALEDNGEAIHASESHVNAALSLNKAKREAQASGDLVVGVFRLTNVGLKKVADDAPITDADMRELGTLLHKLEGALQWLIGDWVVCSEEIQWGELESFAQEIGFTYSTIRTYAYVARNVDLSIRIDKLSFAHHQLVVALPPDQQAIYLDQAVRDNLTVAQLRALITPKPLPATTTERDLPTLTRDIIRLWEKKRRSPAQSAELAQYIGELEAWLTEIKAQIKKG